MVIKMIPCAECDGEGQTEKGRCTDCNGTGRIKMEKMSDSERARNLRKVQVKK